MKIIKDIKDSLDLLGAEIGMRDATIQAKEDRITELEEELDLCGSEDEGSGYNICGEQVMIRVDNIAHEHFFEVLEDVSKSIGINQLTDLVKQLKG